MIRNRLKGSGFFTSKTEKLRDKTYSNQMYGLLDVLTSYAQVDPTKEYFVRVQHGLVDPRILVKDYSSKINKRLAQLVWDKPEMDSGIENILPIGSTFLYLKKLPDPVLENKELAVVPHGGTYNNTGVSGFSVEERHRATLNFLKNLNSSAAVLLYWHDFLDPQIRSLYVETGLKIHCAGFPGLPTVQLSKRRLGGQSKFLENTSNILSQYDTLRIMEPTSTAVYGAFLGLRVKYNQTEYLEQLERETSILEKDIGVTHKNNGLFQSEVMSKLTHSNSKNEAKKILGFHNKKSVEELALILDRFRAD